MYLSNPTPTLLPQTLAWGSFKANDNQMPTLIFSNTLRLNFTGLTQNTAYNWTVKVQKGLPNASALDSNNFTTGAGETTKSLNIYLMAGVYNVGNTYFFGLAQAVAGGEEGIQFDFKIDNRITLDTGGSTITGQLLNQAFSYSGQSFNVLTNRFLDESSLEKTNITVFTNAKIPTTLAVQAYITSLNLPITAGTSSQYYRGDKTFQTLNTLAVPELSNLYFTEARVRSTPLTGFTATNTPITATDSVLVALGEAQGQINSINTNIINIQPQAITTTILNYRARAIADSPTYTPTDQQIVDSRKDLENNIGNHGVLPAFRLAPISSFKRADATSTRVYNTGSLNSGDGTIINGTVGTMVTQEKIVFNGASSQSLSITQKFDYPNATWLVWVDIGTGTGDFMSNQGSTLGVRFSRLGTGQIRFYLADGVNNASFVTCISSFANNQRALVVGTLEQAVGTKLYIGTTAGLTLASSVNLPIANFVSNNNLSIGQDSGGSNYLTGGIFKAMIIPKTLSQGEIQTMFNSERAFYRI